MAGEDPVFGEVIYSYTRKQAIEDGVLVDITEMAKEAGIKLSLLTTFGPLCSSDLAHLR